MPMKANVIKSIEIIFSTHGVALIQIYDVGPQFSFKEFKQFTKDWEFIQTMSSPIYTQSSGVLERNIQTVKIIK